MQHLFLLHYLDQFSFSLFKRYRLFVSLITRFLCSNLIKYPPLNLRTQKLVGVRGCIFSVFVSVPSLILRMRSLYLSTKAL